MAESRQGFEKEERRAKRPAKKRPDAIPEHDQDSDPPRTAQPPGNEPEWQRDEGC